MDCAKVRLAFALALACSLPGAIFASTVSFSKVVLPVADSGQHADLNNDGREDFVYQNNVNGAFEVALSTGGGTYAPPVSYTIPGGADTNSIGIGDFNGDGKADLVVSGSDNAIHLFLNNGSGKFSQKAVFALKGAGSLITVGDFNHDGIMDLALTGSKLTVWFGNGKSGFTTGPTTPFPAGVGGDYVLLGDFDGDGKADLAFGELESSDLLVFYGDGTGHFPKSSSLETNDVNISFSAADVNSDGKMDIIGSQPGTGTRHISVFYGNAARTWVGTTVPIAHCAFNATAADVNGDGINDLIVGEQDCSNHNKFYLGILTRTSRGTYNAEQTVLSASALNTLNVVRATRNTKPDISIQGCLGPCSTAESVLLLNTTTGNFPPCAPPNAFEGINVCSPAAGSTATSPVPFKVGAAGQVVMRKVEVWVDGKKTAEQLNGYSNYTFLTKSLTLSAGSHRVVIFAAGWDNSLEEKVFTLKVK